MSSPTASRSRLRRLFAALIMLVLAAVLAVTGAFLLGGGRGFVVRTPSMGTAAPVGTLVLTRPTTISALQVGQVIAFHPPTEPTETYTHRIIAIRDDAVFTRGDINGTPDPWRLQARDIVGRAVLIVPRLGWLIRALPLLVVGNLVIWAFTALWVRRERRASLRMAGAGLVFALAAQLLRPFLGLVQLETTTLPNGHAAITVVSTGLLPVQVSPVSGHGHAHPVDVAMGQVGVSRLWGGSPTHEYLLHSSLHLSVLGWTILVLVWLCPLLWTLIRGDGTAAEHPGVGGTEALVAAPA